MPRKSWWARLPFGVRMVAGVGALLVLLGGAAGAAVLTRGDGPAETAEQTLAKDPGAARLEQDPEVVSREAAAAEPLPRRHTHAPVQPQPPAAGEPAQSLTETGAELSRARAEDPADRTGSRSPRSAHLARSAKGGSTKDGSRDAAKKSRVRAEAVVTTRTEVETRPIPYRTQVVRDDTLPRGYRKVRVPGAAGQETVRYLVTLVDGRQAGRRVLDTTVTRQPRQRVVIFGTRDECAVAFDLCPPRGRIACTGETDVSQPYPDGPEAGENGSSAVTDEDLALFDQESAADVRLEPTSAC
ncbi:G5 domain-containing protein [Actinoplanes regularis]|uniref:G5 domain-containing protein n=1 Tax=Actinoplanes regularis TaxID=52697 RepID=A0A238V8V6_9ACTN|nr:G5 domain-containing protein [Actinoplanes regularis]SNR30676.1 G5 domain-containing protein [Actinoplanes regularis]